MTKYHFNKDTGRTGKCDAKIQCRLGLAASEHFETREEAQAAYEKTMGKKDVKPLRKTKGNNLDTVRFDVPNRYPYNQDQNLNGKTAAEYRKFIVDTLNEYDGREEEVEKNIVDRIGVGDLVTHYGIYGNAGINHNNELEIVRHLDGNVFGLEDGGPYEGYIVDYEVMNSLDGKEFLDDTFIENDYFIEATPSVDGYYGEEQNLNIRYQIPEDLQRDAIGVTDAKKYKDIADIANSDAFPDWAVVPENVTLDKEEKNLGNPRFQRRPSISSGTILKLEQSLDPNGTRGKISKMIDKTERDLERTRNRLAQIQAVKKSNSNSEMSKRSIYAVTVDYDGDPADLSKPQRDKLEQALTNKIHNKERALANQKERLDSIRELTPQEEAGVKKNIEKLKASDEENIRQYTVDKLSRRYPSSDENVRQREAEKWVKSHPEILNATWF